MFASATLHALLPIFSLVPVLGGVFSRGFSNTIFASSLYFFFTAFIYRRIAHFLVLPFIGR